METVELLKQNLVVEPDLQVFIGFVMESVRELRGNLFRASAASLELVRIMRAAGAASGHPFQASVLIEDGWMKVRCNGQDHGVVQVSNEDTPRMLRLREHLQKSTELIDPEVLNQRNEAMARHLQETRIRTERELAELQVKLLSRQAELQVSIRQAETDPLTGLLNRRAFDERLNQAFRHTMRQRSSPLSLLLLDLDFFKNINDQHGHQYGDSYLNKMAKTLSSVIREDVDLAFRFGGDEFAMMIYSDYGTACDKARQVLQQMEGKVSIGIATIDQHTREDLTLEEFIHKADSALYDAKHRGRGRAVVRQCNQGDTHICGQRCAVKAFCA